MSTRAETLPAHTNPLQRYKRWLQRLVDKHAEDEWVRLLGVRASGLTDEPAPKRSLTLGRRGRGRGGSRMEVECPACDKRIATLYEDDPRFDMIVNAHLDKCIKESARE